MKNKKTLAITAIVIIFVVAIFYRLLTNEGTVAWLTGKSQHHTDIIPLEGRPGLYRVRGVEPESVKWQNSQTTTVVQQPTIDPVYDQTVQKGVVTNFPVGVWVTIYKNFVPGTSVLTSFDTDAELVMFKVRLGGVVITNYASCHPETVRGTNSSAMAKVDVISNSLEVQMLPGQRYNTFAAIWKRE